MIQGILVALIFAAAIVYVGRMIYSAFQSKNACSTGCGKCGAVDFKKLEEQITKSSQFTAHGSQPHK
jgi:hypothetical protein